MEVAEIKMLRFAMGMTRKDKIKNEYIRGTIKIEWLEMKMGVGRLRWYKHVMRRDQEYIGGSKWSYGKEEKRKAEEKLSGYSEGGYKRIWCGKDKR